MMYRIRLTLLVFVMIMSAISVFGQSGWIGLPEVEFYDRDIYGGGSQNRTITQSSSGTLYVANNHGLLSFDGTHWAINREKEFLGIKCLNIIKKKLYLGSFNEFGYLDDNGIKQPSFHSLYKEKKRNTTGDFWNILEYKGSILFLTEKAIYIIQDDIIKSTLFPKSRFLGMYKLNNRVLILDKQEGLFEFIDGNILPIPDGNILSNKAIGSILPLLNGQFLIATELNGFFIGDNKSIKKWDLSLNSLLNRVNVICGVEYGKNYIALGTIQHGVIIIDKKGEIKSLIDKDRGLKNNTVLSVFVDREENIWCGLGNGIAKIKFNTNMTFINEFHNLGTGYAFENFRDYYYLGTDQGLYRISKSSANDPLKENKDFERISGAVGQPWSFFKDENNLLCGHNLGVLQIDGANAKVITPSSVNGAWSFKPFPNSPNLMMVGTYDGLIILEKLGGKWYFKLKVNGYEESGRFIEWENPKSLLVAHSFNGVYRLKFNSNFSEVIAIDSLSFTDFPGNTLDLTNSMIDGQCLFTSRMGIYKLPEGSIKPERFTKYDRLFEKERFPSAIKEDPFGNIWFFSIYEIGVLRKLEDGSFRKVLYPFLPMNSRMVDYFQSAFITDRDNMFFNTKDGFSHYISKDMKDYQQSFYVNLSSFTNSKDSTIFSLDGDKEVVDDDSLPHFSYNSTFSITYSAPFFNDSKIQYSTFIDGWDEEQTSWSENTNRTFSGLREGVYTLTIYAMNSYQIQAMPVKFSFVIDPPWYRSLIAKVFYFLSFIGFIYFLRELLKRQIKRAQILSSIEAQKAFHEREQKLLHEALIQEKKIIELQNENLRSETLIKEKELSNLAIHVVKKNDFLVEINEHLDKINHLDDPKEYKRKISHLINKITQDIDSESNWSNFSSKINQVHASFLNKLLETHPSLSVREQKLCAYIRMGMSSKEIASLQNITIKAVENNRYKLRQRLQLNVTDNLADYIMSL